jgi:branched-chain amino acid transport system ATP-binding protein
VSAPTVQLEGLTIRFGGLRAVNDVSFSVLQGQRRAVIGPNGAGKTTLFNLISGQLRPSNGRVLFQGHDVTGMPVHARARLGMARTFQITDLLGDLSVEENLRIAALAGHPGARRSFWKPLSRYEQIVERADALLQQWDLVRVRATRVEELSYGQQRVLEVVMAMAGEPELLLLDEPTAGLSRSEAALMTEIASNLPRSLTMLVIEHDMDVAFALADTVTVLHNGQVLATGSPDEVRADNAVLEAYLGAADASRD